MDNINYNVFDMLSKLVIEDKSIDEISHILNLEKSFVSTLLKRVRNEYILEFDENNYKYVFKIDKTSFRFPLISSSLASMSPVLYLLNKIVISSCVNTLILFVFTPVIVTAFLYIKIVLSNIYC